MKTLPYLFFLSSVLFFSTQLKSQGCQGQHFSAVYPTETEVFSGSIPLCEDIFDNFNSPDGETDYIGVTACRQSSSNGYNWVTRFFKRETFDNCNLSALNYDQSNPYQTVYFEDFEGDNLDENIWTKQGHDAPFPYNVIVCNDGGNINEPENVKVYDGMLHLEIKKLPTPETFECEKDGTIQTVTKNYSTGLIQTFNGPAGVGSESCIRYGKFTARIKIPRKSGSRGAFWFYGWGGEIDVFEVCMPECGEIQTNRWPYLKDPYSDVCSPGNHTNVDYSIDHNIGSLDEFHTYTLEWTPFKFLIWVDGVGIRQFYRYWRIETSPGGLPYKYHFYPMDCDNLPTNNEFPVWEHFGWSGLTAKLNMILSTGVEGNPSFEFDEMLVDWVKMEQRREPAAINGSDIICKHGHGIYQYKFESAHPEDLIQWESSPNLQLHSQSGNSVYLAWNTGVPSGTGWIEALVESPTSCFGHRIRKEITIKDTCSPASGCATPPTPQVQIDRDCGMMTITVTNPSPGTVYQWQFSGGMYGTPYFTGANNEVAHIPINPGSFVVYFVKGWNECLGVYTNLVVGTSEYPWQCYRLHLYPNPANGLINVELQNYATDNLPSEHLTLYLVNEAFEIQKSIPLNEFTQAINVSDIGNGFYYIYTIIDGYNIVSDKLLIQH